MPGSATIKRRQKAAATEAAAKKLGGLYATET
jgi:hypothetical protein